MSHEKKYTNHFNWHNLKEFIMVIGVQIREKRHGGGLIAIYRQALFCLCLIPALFFIILFRLLKPWVIIRIGYMCNDRIGHFALITEISLCEKDLGINTPNQRFIDIRYYYGYVSNLQLQKMWNRILKIWPSDLSFLIALINSKLPDGELYTIPVISGSDINNVYARIPPHLSFTQEEEEFGRVKLESMGVLPGSLFICFIGRDKKFLQLTQPNKNFDYHDYRNTDVKKYLLAAEEMANRGYYTIRMGSVIREPLTSNNTRIIDYATNGQRSDFMDIYLGAKCHFFISAGSGIDEIPAIFRRPRLYVNIAPLDYPQTWNKDHIFIPKKYWLDKEQRVMSFREIIESGAARFDHTNQYVDMGITLIENTPEEIYEVTIEMEERLKGTWVTTDEDEDLQRRFWSLFKSSEVYGKIKSRIGAAFIRKYQALLE